MDSLRQVQKDEIGPTMGRCENGKFAARGIFNQEDQPPRARRRTHFSVPNVSVHGPFHNEHLCSAGGDRAPLQRRGANRWSTTAQERDAFDRWRRRRRPAPRGCQQQNTKKALQSKAPREGTMGQYAGASWSAFTQQLAENQQVGVHSPRQ